MTSSPFTFSIAFLISKSQFAIKPFSLQGLFEGLVCGSCWALGIITRICRPLAQASDTTYRHNDLQTQRPTELSSERIGEFRKLDPSKPHVLHLAWGQDAPRWHRSSQLLRLATKTLVWGVGPYFSQLELCSTTACCSRAGSRLSSGRPANKRASSSAASSS